ncbi:MAG: alpha-amylase family glycosyl hydrolase [Anaerolineales bacterium]
MQDNIFGTLITDELQLLHHRSHHSGLQHNYEITPQRPIPGRPVSLFATVGPELDAEEVICYYTLDGSQPTDSLNSIGSVVRMIKLTQISVDWDTLKWGYVETWRGEIPAQPEGTFVRYRIVSTKGGQNTAVADWPDPKYRQEMATRAHFSGLPSPAIVPTDPMIGKTFAYHVNRYRVPQWAQEAVIYQIFADRFHPGEGREWTQTTNLRDFCGGTLWGIRDRLDYVQELGATAIWLSPTWPSTSYHGYDITDYKAVSQRLGGMEAMKALVKEAHARGVKILLDLVANHTSSEHPYFREAYEKVDSPYRKHFLFDQSEIGYRTFFGVRSMPQVNLSNEAARKWMIDIARFWLDDFGVDGFRLDHANGPGPEFWAEFQLACKQVNSQSFCFGEVVEPPSDYKRYAGRVDGLLDFGFNDSIRRAYGYGSTTKEAFDLFLKRHLEFFADSGLLLPTFIDNHDLVRFLHIAGEDKSKLRAAAELQFALPGPPIVYYGTEVGMTERMVEDQSDQLVGCRAPMVWNEEQDQELFAFYQSLIAARREAKPWLQ